MTPLFVEMEIHSIGFTGSQDWHSEGYLVLKEKEVKDKTAWLLHIFCSPADLSVLEAHMYTDVFRPLATDLIKNVVEACSGKILYVAIDQIEEEIIFYGYVKICQGEKTFHAECNAADAIGLAVVAKVPIFVSQEVLNEAGMNLQRWEEIVQREQKRQIQKKILEELDGLALEKFKV